MSCKNCIILVLPLFIYLSTYTIHQAKHKNSLFLWVPSVGDKTSQQIWSQN